MKITEVVVPFPKVKKQSNVIGKLPTGHLVYGDITTGLPYIKNSNGARFDLKPGANELPNNYHENPEKPMWWVFSDDETKVYSAHFSKREAELAAQKILRWQKKSAKVVQI